MNFLKEGFHSSLESRWGIAHIEWQDAVPEGSTPGFEIRTVPVFGEDQHLAKPTAQIHFGEHGWFPHMVQTLVNLWHGVRYLFCHVDQSATVYAHPLGAIMLFGKQHTSPKSRVRRFNSPMVQILIQLLSQLHLFLGTLSEHAMTRWDCIRH